MKSCKWLFNNNYFHCYWSNLFYYKWNSGGNPSVVYRQTPWSYDFFFFFALASSQCRTLMNQQVDQFYNFVFEIYVSKLQSDLQCNKTVFLQNGLWRSKWWFLAVYSYKNWCIINVLLMLLDSKTILIYITNWKENTFSNHKEN